VFDQTSLGNLEFDHVLDTASDGTGANRQEDTVALTWFASGFEIAFSIAASIDVIEELATLRAVAASLRAGVLN